MVIAENLAAHVLAGFLYNFSKVKKFCRYCNFSKEQLTEESSFIIFSSEQSGAVTTILKTQKTRTAVLRLWNQNRIMPK